MRTGGYGGDTSMANGDDSIGSGTCVQHTDVCGYDTDMRDQVSEDHANNSVSPGARYTGSRLW
jgi:hypothetical protein